MVGAGAGSEFATWLLRRADFKGLYTLAGIVDDSPKKQGQRFDGVRVLGTTADIPAIVRRHDIGVIFYAISRISEADNRRILETCRQHGHTPGHAAGYARDDPYASCRRDVSAEDVA